MNKSNTNQTKSGGVLYLVVCVIMCIGLLYFSWYSWNAGKESKDYSQICIEGHVYYTINFGNKMAVAIKLDSEGKPVPCIIDLKNK